MENSESNPFLWTKALVLNLLSPTEHLHHGPRLLSSLSLTSVKRPGKQWRHAGVQVAAAPILSNINTQEPGNPNKEELGRGTWMLLHSIAAKYPDKPSRSERRDIKNLVLNGICVHLVIYSMSPLSAVAVNRHCFMYTIF